MNQLIEDLEKLSKTHEDEYVRKVANKAAFKIRELNRKVKFLLDECLHK